MNLIKLKYSVSKNLLFDLFKFSLLLSLVLFVASCGNDENVNYKVKGQLKNVTSDAIFVIKQFTNDSLSVDTVSINKNGEFSLEGKVDGPVMVSLYCGETLVPFVLAPDYDVSVKGDIQQPDQIEVKGGRVNDDLFDFKRHNSNLLQLRNDALIQNDTVLATDLDSIKLKLAQNVKEYVEKYPSKIASVILMNDYLTDDVTLELLGQSIAFLEGTTLDFYLTTNLRTFYSNVKVSSTGSLIPLITLKNSKGKEINLVSFKGKPMLLMFQLEENLHQKDYLDGLKESRNKVKHKINYVSVLIDGDERKRDLNTSKIADSLDWTILLDGKKWNSKEVRKYNIQTVPYYILVSSEGIILERGIPIDSIDSRLAKSDTISFRK